MILEPGLVLEGRYEVLRPLGQGTFATVYEVRHVALHSRHALKVLAVDLSYDEELRKRFIDEGRIQAQLRHPNIAAVTEIVTDPVAGLVMEYVDGPSMDHYLRGLGRTPNVNEVLALMLPILDAVESAHRQGVIHRDLKPENILIGKDNQDRIQPKVVDFGIAKILDKSSFSSSKGKTQAGAKMGTILYMSPEQIRSSDQVDARSDVFALGAILYEVVTGRIAFDASSEFDTMRNIVDGNFTPPERVVGNLHPMLAACIRTALAVDPAERFQNCMAFHRVLASSEDPNAPLPARPTRSAAVTHPPPTSPNWSSGLPPPPPPPPPGQVGAVYSAQTIQQIDQRAPPPNSIAANPETSRIIAVLLSLFCITGAGQMYNGQVGKGIFCFCLALLLGAVSGGVLFIPLWIVFGVDASAIASKHRSQPYIGRWEWF